MDRIEYLLGLIGNDINRMNFVDVEPPNIRQQVRTMLDNLPIVTDSYESETTVLQEKTEASIRGIYEDTLKHSKYNKHFEAENHIAYITRCLLDPLPHHFSSLDPNHSWMLYWLLNSGDMITHQFASDIKELAASKIRTLIVDEGKGGISGGKNQKGHIASTYAAILALVSLKEYDLLNDIRLNLYHWFLHLKQPDGSFIMHENGESDNRSVYCVLVVSSLLNMLTDDLCKNTLEWIKETQTYEGGFAGIKHTEAHGGYTFCGLASLFLLLGKDCKNKEDFEKSIETNIDFQGLTKWLVSRQLSLEGGLNGRSNKLVDACYSFWIGASLALVESIISQPIFNKDALKIYILNCAQNSEGGFRDKPGKSVDFYHTNYTLLGLSVAEHSFDLNQEPSNGQWDFFSYNFIEKELNDDTNTTEMNPVFGLPSGIPEQCKHYFSKSPI